MSDDTPTGAPLKLFNSLTRKLETFTPVHSGVPGDPAQPPEARVYTCGPTVYNYPHIGNMRAYVFADVLGRTLSWKGYKLTHVINITDVGALTDDADAGEDKLEKAAKANAQSIWDIARHYTEAYWADIEALNIRQPAHWSIATDYVPKMIEFAQSIEAHCYELPGGLYFDTSSVAHYGALARAVSDEGEGRIDPVEGKRHAADFAIWRKTPPGEARQMEWDSPWGRGAPGWHLECSVMSGELLGFPFDIHTGGIDHREIHHPNEIAQNQAFCHSDASGANIWMHNNFLVERSGKMSKSAGEFLRLQLLIDRGYHPLAYRLMCLQAHYRSELEFSWEGLEAALVRLKRILGWINALKLRLPRFITGALLDPSNAFVDVPLEFSDEGLGSMSLDYLKRFEKAISDDLDSVVSLTIFEEFLALKKMDPFQHAIAIFRMDEVLGLDMRHLLLGDLRIQPKNARISVEQVDAAQLRRKSARVAKDFVTSDKIRAELLANRVEVMDGASELELSWDWKRSQ